MRLPTFDLRLMASFVALGEELHFSRAAARLSMAQPTLSQQVARLEHQLGVELVARDARGVVLTPAGRRFLTEGQAMIRDAARAQAEISGRRYEIAVHVGDAHNPLIRHVVATFCANYPDVEVKILEGPLSDATRAVLDGDADVGFDAREGIPAELGYMPLNGGPFGLACALDHPLAARERIGWRDLDGETIIFAPEGVADGFNLRLHQVLAAESVAFREVSFPLSKPAYVAAHVASRLGVLVLQSYVFDPRPPGITWVPIVPVHTLEIGLTWQERRASEPIVKRFVAWARRHATIGEAEAAA